MFATPAEAKQFFVEKVLAQARAASATISS